MAKMIQLRNMHSFST